MYKKILAGAAALLMVMGGSVSPVISVFDSFSVTASAEVEKNDGTFKYQIVHGGKSIQILGLVKSSQSTVNIPASIDGLPVTEIGDNAFYNENHAKKNTLTKVTIPDSVVSIGNSAFAYNKALTEIKIPSSVKTLGSSAFEGCSKLKKVELSEGLESIGDKAFYWCERLPSLTIPSSVKNIGEQISYNCGVSDKDKLNFYFNCYFNSVGEHYAFDNYIAYELLDPEKAKNALIDGAIYDKTLRYRIINNGKEIRISDARIGLEEITVPSKIGGLPVTEIGDEAFYNREHETVNVLKKVNLPDTIKVIGDGAFADNEELTQINIPRSVRSIGKNAFEVCKKLEKIDLPEGLETIGESAFTWCQSLTVVTIPASVIEIGKKAFFNCGTITGNSNFFIYCTKGSAGEKYAKDNKIEYSANTLKGDVNGDGTVDIEDAVKVISHVNGQKPLTNAEEKRANVDGNSVVDIEDAVAIISHVNGIKALS